MCNFDIPFTTTPQQLFDSFTAAAQNAGGTVTGDASAGSFDVKAPLFSKHITGMFTTSSQVLHVTVTGKPAAISCNQIRNFLAGKIQ